MIFDILKWLLIVELFGLIGLPIAFRLFAPLPSRGYAFAKALALLLVGYFFWLLASFKFLMNTTSAVVFVLVVLAGVSAYLAWRDRAALRAFVRDNRALIIATELVFLAFFALWVIYRLYNPDLTSTEKPMDYLFLNSALRSPEIPPRDPWLSGYAISYYYFGYLLNSILVRLSAVSVGTGFSLALASIMGLAASSAYSIVYDLITLNTADDGRQTTIRRPPSAVRRRALLFALLGALFVVLIGNFEGVVEVLNARGVGSPEFYSALQIRNLPPTHTASTWYPDDNWWWWRASRVLATPQMEVIDEFPFFSFVIADLHPHVMALPFVLMAIGLALATLVSSQTSQLSNKLVWMYPLLFGALGFLNSWDFPTYTGLVMLAYALNRYRAEGLTQQFVADVIQFALFVGGLGVAFYLPFYLAFSSQASGIRFANILFERGTSLMHTLIFWGFFYFIVASFAVAHVRGVIALLIRDTRWWIYAAAMLLVLFLTALFQWWTAVLMALLVGVSVPLLAQHSAGRHLASTRERVMATLRPKIGLGGAKPEAYLAPDHATTFALLASIIAFALVFVVEFAFIRDSFGTRMNTVFKFYYQAWILLAIACAYFVYVLMTRHSSLVARSLWIAIFAVLCAGTLVYPAAAFVSQTSSTQGTLTLDGDVLYAKYHPDDAAAIAWLQLHTTADSVIVEGMGGDYSDAGRVAVHTSIPNVIGWVGHELQWRGSGDEAGKRERDVNTLYMSPDPAEVQRLLKQYNVTYVFVGDSERTKYANIPLMRMTSVVTKVFEQQATSIFRVK